MGAVLHHSIDLRSEYCLSKHAEARMSGRCLSPSAVQLVLNYGRVVHARGAVIHAVGRKEVERFRRVGVELSSVEGVQVICVGDGTIVTVYRNEDFRGLRPRRRRPKRGFH